MKRKRIKSREELEAQVRLSLPDVLQWFGWPRRTWNKKWALVFPAPKWDLLGHDYWATADVLAWEAARSLPARKSA